METQRSTRRKLFIVTVALVAALAVTLVGATRSNAQVGTTIPDTNVAGAGQATQALSAPLSAVGSGFTYQGQLKQGGNPANGQYDFTFALFDALSGGNQVGSTVTMLNQTVTNGLFTLLLDFGATAFQGDGRWLEIAVRQAGGGTYVTLSPRQALSVAPYAASLMPGASLTGNSSSGLIISTNNGTGSGLSGISPGGIGVYGLSPVGVGMRGDATLGIGVYGQSTSGKGVYGTSTSGDAVSGSATGNLGRGVVGVGSGSNTTGVDGYANGTTGAQIGVRGTTVNGYGVAGYATGGYGVYGSSTNSDGVYGTSTNGYGVYASSGSNAVYATSTGGNGVYSLTFGGSAFAGVYGGSGSSNGTGVHGIANTGIGALGVWGESTDGRGVYGESTGSEGVFGQSTNSYGVYGTSAANGNFAGVYGQGYTGVKGVGYGDSSIGVYGLIGYGFAAGYFAGYTVVAGSAQVQGDLEVDGNCCLMAEGTTRIDDPLDPANKYLNQSLVQSPDMLSILDGNATTDAKGEASIQLPDYFQAANSDFRYQLTVIGQFAQAIVGSEIANNHFTIKTDKPNVKVSWQVSGVRKDPYAQAHPIQPETTKPADEQGKYLHPTELGQPESKGVDYDRTQELAKMDSSNKQLDQPTPKKP